MARKYLFSPIGNTDPIKYLYDGSMIHICRYYQPDVVYLYLSKEMMENHKKDNRYVKTLELLGEFLHHKFEIHIIENSDMIDVQQYDIFYNEFHRIIAEIEEQKDSCRNRRTKGLGRYSAGKYGFRNSCNEERIAGYGNAV